MKTDKNRLIIFCGCCNSDIITDNIKQQVRSTLQHNNISYNDYPDLCGLAAQKNNALIESISTASSVIIIACFPRAVKWLLHSAKISLTEKNIQYLNMREQSAEEIITALNCNHIEKKDPATAHKNNGWIPWFPIIDYNKCINCGQCLDFCLFGVYERNAEKKVIVTAPQNCKNNCPACARICPTVAIIFPKLKESPINGAEVKNENLDKTKVTLNIDEIVGDDLYTALAARQKRARQTLLKRKNKDKANKERDTCKKQMSEDQNGLDIDSLSDDKLLKIACDKCDVNCGSNPNVG
jgi:NAD-dependent dihydropyrimidine dehydrogenase PreA subunit